MESSVLADLWRRCSDEDREGDWAQFLSRVEPRIRGFLTSQILGLGLEPGNGVIDELTQDVYCRLFEADRRALRQCRATCDHQMLAYLKTICRSAAVDHHRALMAKKRGRGSVHSLPMSGREIQPSADRSPEDTVLTHQLRVRLRRLLSNLGTPEQSRRNGWIFERAVVDGWTSREIACRTGLEPSGIDSLISRMKQRLRALGLSVPDRGAPANSLQVGDLQAST